MSPLYDQDVLVCDIGGTVYREQVGNPFGDAVLGKVSFILRAFGGSSATLNLLVEEGGRIPVEGDHASFIQMYPSGNFTQAPARRFGGLVQSVEVLRVNDNFLQCNLSISGYDVLLRERKVVRINTRRLGQTQLTTTQALQLILDQAGLSSGTIKWLNLSIVGEDSTTFDFELDELQTAEAAVNAVCNQTGYYWWVLPSNGWLFYDELTSSPPSSISTLKVYAIASLPTCPVDLISLDAAAYDASIRFSNVKYRVERVLPTMYAVADSVDTLTAGESADVFTTTRKLPPDFAASSAQSIFGPLLPTTVRVSAASVIAADGSPTAALTIHEEPFEEGMTFVEDAAVDIGVKDGDQKYLRLENGASSYIGNEAGFVQADEQRWHGYGEATDATRETAYLAQQKAGTGRTTDYFVDNTIPDDPTAETVANALLNARPTRLRSASFNTQENGIEPLQMTTITHTDNGLTAMQIFTTQVSYQEIDKPDPIHLAAGKVFDLQVECAPSEPPSAESEAATTRAAIGVIKAPKPPLVGTAPQALVCSFDILSIFAGDGTAGETGDTGPAVDAKLNLPSSVAVGAGAFAGKIYIAESGNASAPVNADIRVVDLSTGNIDALVSISAGGRDPSFTALAWNPDNDMLYAAVRDNVVANPVFYSYIIEIDPSDGSYTIVCGSDSAGTGFSGDGGAATAAIFESCNGMTFAPDGDLTFSDSGNNRIRKFTIGGNIDTIVGDGSATFSGDAGDAAAAGIGQTKGVVYDSAGNLYLCGLNRIRKVNASDNEINTIAGTGTATSTGDGGLASAATLKVPFGLAIDMNDNLYVTELTANKLRMIAAATGIIEALVNTDGVGNTPLDGPAGVAYADAVQDGLYVAVVNAHRVFALPCYPTSPAPSECANSGDAGINNGAVDGDFPMDETNAAETGDPDVFLNEGTKDTSIDLTTFALDGTEEQLLIRFFGELSITDAVGTVGIGAVASVRAVIDGDIIFADFLSVITEGMPGWITLKPFNFTVDATPFIGSVLTVNFFISGQLTREPSETGSFDAIIDITFENLTSGSVLCVQPQV